MQVREREGEFQASRVRIAVVTFEAPTFAVAYVRRHRIAWPLLVDERRATYAAYGMARGRLWDVYGPSAWWVYLKEARAGRFPTLPNDDTRQLGGDVIIDAEGVVRFHHVGRGPADRPPAQVLLDVCTAL